MKPCITILNDNDGLLGAPMKGGSVMQRLPDLMLSAATTGQ